jgi:hypothetical protein
MANPLLGGRSEGPRDIEPGETRTWTAGDKTFTLTRTERPYVFDLRDCYNDARTAEALRRGVEWYVNAAGELKIGFSAESTRADIRRAESRLETERARFIRHHLENAREGNGL